MRKTILSLLLTFVLISLIGCTLGAPQPKLTLDAQNVDMYVGDTYEIKPILENSSNKIFVATKVVPQTNMVKAANICPISVFLFLIILHLFSLFKLKIFLKIVF